MSVVAMSLAPGCVRPDKKSSAPVRDQLYVNFVGT